MAQEFSSADLMVAIVDLRDATGAGFTALRNEMNVRFEDVDRRFDALDYKINRRFDLVDQRFDAVDRRFDALERS